MCRASLLFVFLILASLIGYSQCVKKNTFYPTPSTNKFTQFGESIDTYEDVLVVGAYGNDSLGATAGLVYIYKLNATTHEWDRIAVLTPSVPSREDYYGYHVSVYKNTIAVSGRTFQDDGSATPKIYIYEKSDGTEWTSTTESYSMPGQLNFELSGDELVTSGLVSNNLRLLIYRKVNGILSLAQTLNIPADKYGHTFENLSFDENTILLGSPQFIVGKYTGAVFVYEKHGAAYNNSPDATLFPSDSSKFNWLGFAESVSIKNSTILIGATYYPEPDYSQAIYIYERPLTGWKSGTESQSIKMNIPAGYQSSPQLVMDQNYIFFSSSATVDVYKKTLSDWSAGISHYSIPKYPGSYLGDQIRIANDHLVIIATGYGDDLINGRDRVLDYYSPTHTWDNLNMPNQVLEDNSVNASYSIFGKSISAVGNTLVVGAPEDSEMGFVTGEVYVFKADNPVTPIQKLHPPKLEAAAAFGTSVAVGDSVLFASAVYEDTVLSDGSKIYGIGKVYVFRLKKNGWQFHSEIVAPVIYSDQNFGQEIVYHNGYVAITEYYLGNSESIGHVHLFKEDESGYFNHIASLQAGDGQAGNSFGRSLAMNDSLLVIGTGNSEHSIYYSLKTFVFRKKGEWKDATADAILISSNKGWNDHFGTSVSLSGDYIVVGAPLYPGYDFKTTPLLNGTAYVFKRPTSGWKGTINEIAQLSPSDPVKEGFFGYSVVITGDDIFIGAPQSLYWWNVTDHISNNNQLIKPGKVYHYVKKNNEWVTTSQEDEQLMSDNPNWMDGFGSSLYAANGVLFIASEIDNNQTGFFAGSVQSIPVSPWIDGLCTNGNPVKLPSIIQGGIWSGQGVDPANGTFNPKLVSVGTYELTCTLNDCSKTLKATVVAPYPLPMMNPVCSDGAPVNLAAIASGGQWIGPNIIHPSETFDPHKAGPGNYNLSYKYNGCFSPLSLVVVQGDPNVILSSESLLKKCTENDIPIIYDTDADVSQYVWFFKNRMNDPYIQIDSKKKRIDAVNKGYYSVEIQNTLCKADSAFFTVNDFDPVNITIKPTPTICSDNTTKLIVSPDGGLWSGTGISNDGLLNGAQLQDGDYSFSYVYTSLEGCHTEASTNVNVDKLVKPKIIMTDEYTCSVSPVVLALDKNINNADIEWSLLPGRSITNGSTVTIIKPGTYVATLSKNGCTVRTDSVLIFSLPDSLFVPNIFTPDGDSFNPSFEITAMGIASDFTLVVVNRYGNSVYHAEKPDFKWDGSNVSEGIYYWIINYANCAGDRKQAKGWVHVFK